ncbi:MAG: OmpH family outer membrane protein [Planctomycetota bacterium]
MVLRRTLLRLGIPAALVPGAASALNAQAPLEPSRQAAPTTAVVDMDRVLREYAPARKKQEEFADSVKSMQSQLEALGARFDEAVAKRSGFEDNSPERAEATLEVELLRIKREKMQEIRETELSRRRVELAVDLFEEISMGIGAFAKQKGIQVVFRARNLGESSSMSQRYENNQARDMVWFDPAADITDQVIAFLKGWQPPATGK